ncbi:unnamed protein product [Blepharisma stoltei]|uniref:Uncharacterized protein n=1 Tax=Blepharisma stoltei TaxID=1481888 RepID=A0AAU9JX41_9CILI|nr:unnamed protein product [Blepharisma stoltei]
MDLSRKFLQKYIEKDHENPSEQLKIKYSAVRLPKLKLLRSIDVSPMQKRKGFSNSPLEDLYKPKLINQSATIIKDLSSFVTEFPNHRKRKSQQFEPDETKSSIFNDITLDEQTNLSQREEDVEEKPKPKKKIVCLSIPQVVYQPDEDEN